MNFGIGLKGSIFSLRYFMQASSVLLMDTSKFLVNDRFDTLYAYDESFARGEENLPKCKQIQHSHHNILEPDIVRH